MAKSLAIAAALLAPAGASFLRQAPSDPCACVNWAQAYRTGGAKCGDGHELYVGTSGGMPRFVARMLIGIEFCEGLFKRIDDNFCMNLDHDNRPDQWYGGQWCYTSGECAVASKANGTGSLRMKLCKQGEDKMLRDKLPEEIISFAKANDFETGLLLKMAYPVDKHVQWPMLKQVLLDPASGQVNLMTNETTKALFQKMWELKDAGKPVIFNSKDGHLPFAVVRGSTVHLLEAATENADTHRPNTMSTVKCVEGCSR